MSLAIPPTRTTVHATAPAVGHRSSSWRARHGGHGVARREAPPHGHGWFVGRSAVRLLFATAVACVAGGATPRPAVAQNAPVGTPADTLALSLAEVQRLVVAHNPGLLATRQETAIARGGLRQARTYRFNPDLVLQSAGGFGGSGSPYELVLTQEIEWAGQRGLRVDAARTGLARAASVVQDAGRVTLADASAAFYRALAADRRLAVTRDALALTERLLAAVRTQLTEGEISTLEANLAGIEAGRARGRVLAALRAATTAELELKEFVGLAPDTPVRLVGEAPDASLLAVSPPAPPPGPPPVVDAMLAGPLPGVLDQDSLVALALARRPDLAASTAAVREFETLTALARREALPNLRLGAVVEGGEDGGSPQIGPAVGLSLPLLNRNRGIADQRQALAEQARLERRAIELRVRTDVVTAVRAYRTATEEAAIFAASVLLPARQNTQLLETAYRAGKIDLPTLLLLRNQLVDAELGYWDAWLAQREALARLHAATGVLTPPAASLQPLDAGAVDGPVPVDSSARTSR